MGQAERRPVLESGEGTAGARGEVGVFKAGLRKRGPGQGLERRVGSEECQALVVGERGAQQRGAGGSPRCSVKAVVGTGQREGAEERPGWVGCWGGTSQCRALQLEQEAGT